MDNKNKPAFPTKPETFNSPGIEGGLTKREYFTAIAMQGIVQSIPFDSKSNHIRDDVGKRYEEYVQTIAFRSIKLADEILSQLTKNN